MAVTDWSSVEFANTTSKSRKAQDFLPIICDLLAVWDFFACLFAGEAALSLYRYHVFGEPLAFFATGPLQRDIIFGSVIATLVLRDSEGLLQRASHSPWQFVLRAEWRCGFAFAMLIAVGSMTRATEEVARLWLMSWFAFFGISVACTRAAFAGYIERLNGRGELRESIAIIGAAGARARLAARIADEANIVGTFCTQAEDDISRDDDADMASLLQLGRNGSVDSIILALERDQQTDPHIIERLKSLPVQVAVCREDGWSSMASPQMRLLGGLPMAVVADRPIKRWDLLLKTGLDKFGAAMLLLLLSPLLLAVGIAVGLNSPGPIIFRQKRQGWCGREFTVFKFRTMHHVVETSRNFQTRRNDRRCTSVGRILRSTSLDELPQLWNVLRGDMSLVGPRPHAETLHDMDRAGRKIVAEYAQRHRVRPGMTGWAQVQGARGATATLEQLSRRVEYDLYYIENWSIWLDVKILFHTPFCLAGENAF